jgi:hypothetical protein
MSNYLDLLTNNKHVSEVYEVVGEWEVWIGFQKVKIKIKRDINGKFVHETSHYYHGSEQAGAYISSINGYETIELALQGAIKQLLMFYDPDDEKAKWVENDSY